MHKSGLLQPTLPSYRDNIVQLKVNQDTKSSGLSLPFFSNQSTEQPGLLGIASSLCEANALKSPSDALGERYGSPAMPPMPSDCWDVHASCGARRGEAESGGETPCRPALAGILKMANGLLANDVLWWKAIGAAVWAAAIAVAASTALGLILSPATLLSPSRLLGSAFSLSTWLWTAALVLAQAPAFAGAAAALRARDPHPAHLLRLLQWPCFAPVSMLVAKLAGRLSSAADFSTTAAFFALHAVSAVPFLYASAAASGTEMGGEAKLQGTPAF
jgi:hypothetical protein